MKICLTKALEEARQLTTDEKVHAMFIKYPEMTEEAIAEECGITREQFNRTSRKRAVKILVEIFQRLVDQEVKSD